MFLLNGMCQWGKKANKKLNLNLQLIQGMMSFIPDANGFQLALEIKVLSLILID